MVHVALLQYMLAPKSSCMGTPLCDKYSRYSYMSIFLECSRGFVKVLLHVGRLLVVRAKGFLIRSSTVLCMWLLLR